MDALPQLITDLELDHLDLPEPKWLLPSLLFEGNTLLIAPPKRGKSLLCAEIAYSLASGKAFLGGKAPNRPYRVLFVALEDSLARLKKRFALMRKALGVENPLPTLYIARPHRIKGNASGYLQDLLNETRPEIAIIDVLGRLVQSIDSNKYFSWSDEMEKILGIFSQGGVSSLLVHHERKEKQDSSLISSVLGSQAIAGSVDAVMRLAKMKVNVFRLEAQGRDFEEFNVHLIRSDGVYTLCEGDALFTELTELQRAVYGALALANQALGPSEIARTLGVGTNKRDSVLKALNRLRQLERVEQFQNSKWALKEGFKQTFQKTIDMVNKMEKKV